MKLTPKAERVLAYAASEALRKQKAQVDIPCLLVALAGVDGLASKALNFLNLNIDGVQNYNDGVIGESVDCTDDVERILLKSQRICTQLSNNYVGSEHLLLAVLLDKAGAELVSGLGADVNAIARMMLQLLGRSQVSLKELRHL